MRQMKGWQVLKGVWVWMLGISFSGRYWIDWTNGWIVERLERKGRLVELRTRIRSDNRSFIHLLFHPLWWSSSVNGWMQGSLLMLRCYFYHSAFPWMHGILTWISSCPPPSSDIAPVICDRQIANLKSWAVTLLIILYYFHLWVEHHDWLHSCAQYTSVVGLNARAWWETSSDRQIYARYHIFAIQNLKRRDWLLIDTKCKGLKGGKTNSRQI